MASPHQLHSHRNAPEFFSLEVLKAQRSLVISLYRTLEYNEISGIVGSNLLWREVCYGEVSKKSGVLQASVH